MSDSLRGLSEPFKTLAGALLEDLRTSGIRFRLTSGRRSRAEQTRLYNDFLAGRTRLPVARPGSSLHELGLAIDLVFETVPEWLAVASVAPGFGLLWRRSDPVHFELAPELYSLVTSIPPIESPLGRVLDFLTISEPKCDPFAEAC